MVFEIQYTDAAGVTQRKSFSNVGVSDSMDVYMQSSDGERTLLKEMARPIVLEGAETLTESIRSVDDLITSTLIAKMPNGDGLDEEHLWKLAYQNLDTQTLSLKTALRMHEIMMHSIVNDGHSNVGTHTPVVFKVEVDGRTRVGWHFEKNEQATLGSRGHYDHGLSVSHHTNRDKEVIAVPPLSPEQLKARFSNMRDAVEHVVLLLKDGTLLGGASHYMHFNDSMYINGQSVPLSEIACATRLPDEQSDTWKLKVDAGDPKHEQKVFAWDNDRVKAQHAGPYVDFSTFDATGRSNARFQGATGAFFAGAPWSAKKSWNTLEGVAECTLLKESHALRQHLVQRRGLVVENTADAPAVVAPEQSNARPKR